MVSAASSVYAPLRRDSSMLGRGRRNESRNDRRRAGKALGLIGLVCVSIRYWRDKLEGFTVFQKLESQLQAVYSQASASLRPILFVLIKWVASLHTKLIEVSGADEDRHVVHPSVTATATTRGENEAQQQEQQKQHPHRVYADSSDSKSSSSEEEMTSVEDDSIASRHLLRITENQKLINEVLHYWFGQFAPDDSQKRLWMISAQSLEHRNRVDREINDKFGGLLLKLVRKEDRLDEWCADVQNFGYRGKVAAIVVLDQFSRHIHRYIQETKSVDIQKSPLPKQFVMDNLAFQTARLFMQDHASEIEACMIPMPMYIFSLMPYRHQATLGTVGLVQTLIEHSNDLWTQCDSMLRRFRKATNRRMAVLQDRDRQAGDSKKTAYDDEDILECYPFQADMTTAKDHEVVRTMCSFLKEIGINPIQAKTNGNGKRTTPMPVIVSLSGGVDSMVIASALVYLKRSQGYNITIAAVHIDYANRPDSKAESDYVESYCDQLGIEFFVRRIDEMTRGVTNRDAYEKQTRQIRFGMYRDTIEKCREASSCMEVGVFLGHHRGDLRENVLSNAHKGCGPLDLSGMTSVSMNDGVFLYRPLLPLEKTAVFDYAHSFGVPYFKDTTPHWSTRGKLRNNLLPLLEEIYGEGSLNNLSNLAVESDECRALLHELSFKPFLNAVKRKAMGISFQTTPWKKEGLFFWKIVLREALHSVSLGMWSDKSVEAFLERVTAKQPKPAWLQCRRDYAVYLGKEGHVHVLSPRSFPFRKCDVYNTAGMSVEYSEDEEKPVTVGPWHVTASWQAIDSLKSLEKEILVGTAAVSSFDWLMEGVIEYYIRTPTWESPSGSFEPRPLVFRKFDKATRPRAWKGSDVKIQDVLPIIGNDQKAEFGLKDPRAAGCTHKNDKGTVVPNPTKVIKIVLRLAEL